MWNLYEIHRRNEHNIYLITFIDHYGEDKGWYVDLVKYSEDLDSFIHGGLSVMWALTSLQYQFDANGRGALLLEDVSEEEVGKYLKLMQVVE